MAGARRTAFISLGLLIACNSIVGFDDLSKQPKGKTSSADGSKGDDDDTVGDDDDDIKDSGHDKSSSGGPRCDPTKPFGAPVIVPLDSTAETKRAIMTRDELEIFYLRGNTSPFELRHAIRASQDADWGEPTTEALSPSATELGSVVLNGLKLYYWNVNTGGTSGGVVTLALTATRPKVGAGGFSTGKALAGVDRSVHAAETDDSIYWAVAATIDGAGNELLHRGNLQGSVVVGDMTLDGVHQYPSLDDKPVVSTNELTLYFASTRPGNGAQGSSDVWRATRASKAETFSNALNVTELNTTTLDEPSWVSDDDCVILLDRSRHILLARRPLD